MKRIVKKGKLTKNIRQFKCPYCGCVFEADEDDYTMTADSHNDYCLESECPTCNRMVYIDEE